MKEKDDVCVWLYSLMTKK